MGFAFSRKVELSPSNRKPATVGAKLVILGGDFVGKTSLFLRFTRGEFNPRQVITRTAEQLNKNVLIDNIPMKLEIWDTPDQENTPFMYYRGAQGVIVVFDICNKDSYYQAQNWIDELQRDHRLKIIIQLVGNKIDLAKSRMVTSEEAQNYAEDKNILYIETSAKTAEHVDELFMAVGRKYLEGSPIPAIA